MNATKTIQRRINERQENGARVITEQKYSFVATGKKSASGSTIYQMQDDREQGTERSKQAYIQYRQSHELTMLPIGYIELWDRIASEPEKASATSGAVIDAKLKQVLTDLINRASEKAKQYKELKDRYNYLATNLPLGATYEIEQLKPKKAGAWGRFKAFEYSITTIMITYRLDADDLEAEGLHIPTID